MKEKLLEKFDDNFFSIDKFGVIYGKDGRITMSNNYNQIEAIKNLFEEALDEYGAEKYEKGYLDGKNNQPKGLNK